MKRLSLFLKLLISNAWYLIAIIFGFIFYFDFGALCSNSNTWSILGLKNLIFINCIGFVLLTILINVWSIYQTHKYLDENKEKILKEKDMPCDYCSHKTSGPLLCYECGSILYGRINSTKTDVAVFIAQHRWSLMSGFFALVLFAPISFIYTKMNEIIKDENQTRIEKQQEEDLERVENTKSLNKILDNLSDVRSKIVNLETRPFNEFDIKEWEELHSAYTSIYWNIVPSFEHLLESTTQRDSLFSIAIEETDNHKMSIEELRMKTKGNGFVRYAPAFVINHDSFELSSVSYFIKYMNTVSQFEKCLKKGDKKLLLESINARKIAANNIYHRLRITSIMMRLLIDSQWLLKEGVYPSESADSAFYFQSIFVQDSDLVKAVYDLEFNYSVRNFDAFEELTDLR